jgi:deoxyribonuclease-4
MKIKFGTAGVPNCSKDKSTIGGIRTIKELGLDAMEVQFVRGVKMNLEKAKEVRDVAKTLDIELSVHAPYYINLNADKEDKLEASVKRLIDTVRVGGVFARNIVFHPGYYLKSSKEKAYRKIADSLKPVLEYIEQNKLKVVLRPETTGKPTQFGELDETLNLCHELGLKPCIDFSHIHARTRAMNSYKEFSEILTRIEDVLGKSALKDMHMHVSGIEYGLKGEKKHLNLDESDFKYVELLEALRDFGVRGIIIIESPNLEEDAVMLKKRWRNLTEVKR